MTRLLPVFVVCLALSPACGGGGPRPTARAVGCLELGERHRLALREAEPPPPDADPRPMLGNPELPTAVGRGQEVCVVARMVVTQRGEVREVELLEVDGALDAGAIVETLQRWTFEPPLYEGVSADVTLVRPFTVRLLFPAEAR